MSDFKSPETATANIPPIYPDEKRPQKVTAHSVSVDDYPEESPPEYSAIFDNPPTSSYEVKYKDWKCTTANFIDATSNNKQYLADLPSFIHGRIKLRSAHTSDEVLGRSNVWKPKKNISATYRGTDLQMKYQSLVKLNYPWVSTVSLPTSSSSQPVVSNSKLLPNDLVLDTASDAGSDAGSDKEHIHGVSNGVNMKWQYRGDFGKLGNMEYVLFRTDGNSDTSRETINEPVARWRVQGPKVGPFKDLGRVEIFGDMSREQKEEVFLTGLTAVYIEIVARSNATLGTSAIGTMVAVGKGGEKK